MKKVFAIIILTFLTSCGQNSNNTTLNETKTETVSANICDTYFEKLTCSLKSQNLSDEDIAKHIETTKTFVDSQPIENQKLTCEGSLENLKQALPESC